VVWEFENQMVLEDLTYSSDATPTAVDMRNKIIRMNRKENQT
jgi:hypothetical protein